MSLTAPAAAEPALGADALLRVAHLQRFIRARRQRVEMKRRRAEVLAQFLAAEAAAFIAAEHDSSQDVDQGITPEVTTLSPESQRTQDEPSTPNAAVLLVVDDSGKSDGSGRGTPQSHESHTPNLMTPSARRTSVIRASPVSVQAMIGDDTPHERLAPVTDTLDTTPIGHARVRQLRSEDWRQLMQPIQLDIHELEPEDGSLSHPPLMNDVEVNEAEEEVADDRHSSDDDNAVGEVPLGRRPESATAPSTRSSERPVTPITTAMRVALARCDDAAATAATAASPDADPGDTTLGTAKVAEELMVNTVRYGEQARELLLFEEGEARDELEARELRTRRQRERELHGALQLSRSSRALVLRWKVADLEEMQQTVRARIEEAEAADAWFIMEHHAHLREVLSISSDKKNDNDAPCATGQARRRSRVTAPVVAATRSTLSKRLSILLHNESSMRIQHQRSEEVEREAIQLARRRERMAYAKVLQLIAQVESHENAFRAQVMHEWVVEHATMTRARQDELVLLCERAEAAGRVQIQRDEMRHIFALNVNAIINADVLRRVAAITAMETEGRRRIAEVAETTLAVIRDCLWERHSLFGDVQRREGQRRMDLIVHEMEDRQALWRAGVAITEVLAGRRDDLRRSSAVLVDRFLHLSQDDLPPAISVATSLATTIGDTPPLPSHQPVATLPLGGAHDGLLLLVASPTGVAGNVRFESKVEHMEALYRERVTKQETLAFQWLSRRFAANLVHALHQSEVQARDEIEYEEALAIEFLRRRCARLRDDASRIARLKEEYVMLNRKYSIRIASPLSGQHVQKMISKLIAREHNHRGQLELAETSYREAIMDEMASDMPLGSTSLSSSVALWKSSTSTLFNGRAALSSFRHTVHPTTGAGRSDRVARIVDDPEKPSSPLDPNAPRQLGMNALLAPFADTDSVMLMSTTSQDNVVPFKASISELQGKKEGGAAQASSPLLPSPKLNRAAAARRGIATGTACSAPHRGANAPDEAPVKGISTLAQRQRNEPTYHYEPRTVDGASITQDERVPMAPLSLRTLEKSHRASTRRDTVPLTDLYFDDDRLHLSCPDSDVQALDELVSSPFAHLNESHKPQSPPSSPIDFSATSSEASLPRPSAVMADVPPPTTRGAPLRGAAAAPTLEAVHVPQSPMAATSPAAAATQIRLSTRQPASKPREPSALHHIPPFMVTVDDLDDVDEYNFSEIDV